MHESLRTGTARILDAYETANMTSTKDTLSAKQENTPYGKK